MHAADGGHGTVSAVLEVTACFPHERDAGRWRVTFRMAGGGAWTAVVGSDGRDRHGYVEPVAAA